MVGSSRPKIILSAAVSIDGKIASVAGDSQLSSRDDITRLHRLRSKVDAILVGINTVLADDPLLTVRRAAVGAQKTENPARIVLDSKARIPVNSKIIETSGQIQTIIAVSQRAPQRNLQRLQQSKAKVVVAGTESVDLKALLDIILDMGIGTILVEGGGTINWEFVRQDLFDEIIVTVSPFLLGGRSAVSFVEGAGFPNVSDSPTIRLKSVRRLQNHLVLSYVHV